MICLNYRLICIRLITGALFFISYTCNAASYINGTTIGTHFRTEYTIIIPGVTKKTNVEDSYISSNGLYQANYKNGGEEIDIYHLSKKLSEHYAYKSSGPDKGWSKLPSMPNINTGIAAVKALDHAIEAMNPNKWQYIGNSMIASLPCKQYRMNSDSGSTVNCVWKSDVKGAVPATITLSSISTSKGGGSLSSEVKLVEFGQTLNLKTLFTPPSNVNMKDVAKDMDQEIPNNPWCIAEQKKTGVNPCLVETDDDN